MTFEDDEKNAAALGRVLGTGKAHRGLVTLNAGHSRVVVITPITPDAMIMVSRVTPEPPDPLGFVYNGGQSLKPTLLFAAFVTRDGFFVVANKLGEEWRTSEDIDLAWETRVFR